MKEIQLGSAEASSAAAIQQAIDALGSAGGRVALPAGEIMLDRGLQLRSHVELVGQGAGTLLRHAPGRVYPLSGYHNYGMCDVPLLYTDGLQPGMTVAIRDNRNRGFFETFARITWIDGNWVGLDHGIEADYLADQEPVLVTSFPLIYGLDVAEVAVRDLRLDGNRDAQPAGILACRGAAVYFIRSHHIAVSDVDESGFYGEGLGFQMCHHVTIQRCRFARNLGNGFHPGAGSTAALFADCVAEENALAGFFFCVRANHITVRGCAFRRNTVAGVSIGTRDCHNLITDCQMADNLGPGVLVRGTARPVEVHSIHITGCRITGNARDTGKAQVDIIGSAHDIILEGNRIAGESGQERAGVFVAPTAHNIWLADNEIARSFPALIADRASLATARPAFAAGTEVAEPIHFRHLPA